MDLLIVAREEPGLEPTASEVSEPAAAKALIPRMPHGAVIAGLLSRLALGAMVLAQGMDRGASRAAIGVAMGRHHPKGVVLLGYEVSRELLGEQIPLVGGLRDLHSKPVCGIGRAKAADIERLLVELCLRANVPWAPPGSRAAPTRLVLKAEEAEAQAALLIEHQQWAKTVQLLEAAEPLGPRGTNMLGRALLATGDQEGARRAFERTLQADPLNGIAQRQLAQLGG